MNITLKDFSLSSISDDIDANYVWDDVLSDPYVEITDNNCTYKLRLSLDEIDSFVKSHPKFSSFKSAIKTIAKYKSMKPYMLLSSLKKETLKFDFVDKIYCIHYLPYKNRIPDIKCQLNYHNIAEQKNFEFYYTTPNKYYDYLLYDSDAHIDIPLVNVTNINYTVNSYNLLKQAYDLGCQKVMIIEDDVVFLKNKDIFMTYLMNMPKDYDLIMLEYFIAKKDNAESIEESYFDIINNNSQVNDYYVLFTDETIYDTGFFVLSRKMMKHMIDNTEKLALPFDGYTRNMHVEDDFGIKRCISRIPLALQREYAVKQDINHNIDKYPYVDKTNYVF